MSVSGSIIALLLFALKPLIKNRLPKSVQYYLWLVVIAALLLPVSKFVTIPQYAEHIPPVPIYNIVEWNVISTSEENDRIIKIHQENPIITDFSSQQSPLSGFVDAAFVIYPIGVAAILLYHFLTYAVFLKKMRSGSVRADVKNKIPVYINPKATTPMLVGLFHPTIYLPNHDYTDAQLQTVLLHEMTHLRRKDILVKWLSVLACALHWFNPFVWLVRREIDRACELSCDEAVITKLDTNGRQTYGDTLIYVAADRKPRTALAMSESGRNLKERLGAIMKNKKQTRIAIIVSALLLIAIAGAAIVLGAGANTTITLNSLLGKTVNMGPAVGDPPAVEIPNVQVFVYDDGQGNERYVMFEDDAKHSREEIMSAQTVTADEINKVFAGFTSKFRFEIRAMSHDGFDKARFDKIAAL
jgi:beta-lactamase regulating signal transducer with metallopeptidase domain